MKRISEYTVNIQKETGFLRYKNLFIYVGIERKIGK
jgi:hypothetical protein